ncbi:hypothetical protein LXL04_039715 [Taraxacum kok-saghyz]
MKKLEDFMIQQSQNTKKFMEQQNQNTKELKESNLQLREAVLALQTKHTSLEEELLLQSKSKGKKQGSEGSCEEGGDKDRRFDDGFEVDKGRSRGPIGIVVPDGKTDPIFQVRGDESEEEVGLYTGDDGGPRDNRVPKFTKMEFPTYDGKEDPLAWLQKCEDFFEEQQTPTEAWVRQATFVLQGNASSWYQNLRRMKGRMNWLTHFRQTSTVEDYCTNFETKLARTSGVTPEQSTWHFCAGLKSGIRYEVEFARPTTLYYAMNLARQIEFRVSEANPPRFTGHNRNTGGTRTRDMTTPRPEVRNSTWKRLTSAEMADRRAKGLCFNCDELFAVGHKCAKLFCIMMTDDEDETTTEPAFEDMPLISLNAIRGSKTDQTFQVRARVGTGIAWVLLDSGSTHNFIVGRGAQQLQVAVKH